MILLRWLCGLILLIHSTAFCETVTIPDFLIESHLPISRNPSSRRSHDPLISGDSFRSLADHIIDETKIPFDPTKVQSGDIIFVGRPFLGFFFDALYPHISSRFFLITSNGSGNTPERYSPYLKEDKIIKWFARNVDLPKHPKMSVIPLGICWFFKPNRIKTLLKESKRLQYNFRSKKTIFCNVSFKLKTNTEKRTPCLAHFAKQDFATVLPFMQFDEYIKLLKRSRFVISPEGYNIDCFRTWESLLCGAYPVVLSSSIDSLFEDLPVVIVNSWEQVTHEFLQKKEEEFKERNFNLEKIQFKYWREKILSEKSAYLCKGG